MISAPLNEYLCGKIPQMAAKAHRGYGRIPREDFEQEMWLYVLEHADTFEDFYSADELGKLVNRLKNATGRIRAEDQRYQRAVKAAAEGYDVDDEQYYSRRSLRSVFEALVNSDFDIAGLVFRASSQSDGAGIRTQSDGGSLDDYQAMLIDVKNAYARLTPGQQHLLKTYYTLDQSDTDAGRWERQSLAGSMGLSEEALRQRASRAVDALQDKLGGRNPW